MARKMTVELEAQQPEGDEWVSVLSDSATPAAIRQAKALARQGVTVRLTISAYVKPSAVDTEASDSELEEEVA